MPYYFSHCIVGGKLASIYSSIHFSGKKTKFCLTSANNEYKCSGQGIVVSLPKFTYPKGEKIDLAVQTCLGPFVFPDGYDVVSAVYWIESQPDVKNMKMLSISIEHNELLKHEADCKRMTFLSANVPETMSSCARYIFRVVSDQETIFRRGEKIGIIQIQLKKSSLLAIGKQGMERGTLAVAYQDLWL